VSLGEQQLAYPRYHNTHSCHVLFLFLRYHNTHSCEYCNKLFHERFEDTKGIIGSRNWMTDNTMTTRKGPKDKQCLTKNTKKPNNWAARSLQKTWGKLMFTHKNGCCDNARTKIKRDKNGCCDNARTKIKRDISLQTRFKNLD
jgi:hypothetical protein